MLTRRIAALASAFAVALLPAALSAQPSPRPDPAAVPIDARQRKAVVASLAQLLRERFAFPERGLAAAREIEAMERRGEFAEADTAAELVKALQEKAGPVVNDRHFRVRYLGPEVTAQFREGPPPPEEVAAFHAEVRARGSEVPRVEWLAGNVGYVRLTRLFPPDVAGAKVEVAMRFLADTEALVIDVRGTPGGDPEGVANLIGYLISERTRTVDVKNPYDRSRNRSYYAEPKTPSFAGKPVYVLIDGDTGSGAEELAYDLQAMKRATLVGQTTYGAATPGGFRPLAEGFAAFIPMEVVTNAITGKHWEGVGVKPDVEAPSAEALSRAHRLALEHIVRTKQGLAKALAEEALAELDRAAKS